jgi:hypothetical protein
MPMAELGLQLGEVIDVRKEIEFTVDKVWDADVVEDMLKLIDDILKKNGYRISYNRTFRRFKVIIEGGDGNEKV